MIIKDLRIRNNNVLNSVEGEVAAPPSFFMDLQLNEIEEVSVPIGTETYLALNSLMIQENPSDQIGNSNQPMGVFK